MSQRLGDEMGRRFSCNCGAWIQSVRRLVGTARWFVLLALLMSTAAMFADRAEARSSLPGHHVYCIRGAFNIFSLGMDEICDKLKQMGFNTSVHNHLVWGSLASEAAENYKSGRERTIILIGQSAGVGAIADMTRQLGAAGVPVKLAVGLDCVLETVASGRVDHFINLYVGSGAGKRVTKGADFKGDLQNIDVSKNSGVGHFSIDKNPAIQAKVIQYVRQAMSHPQAPKQALPTAANEPTTTASSRSAAAKTAGAH